MKVIDIKNWKRKEHFEFFSGMKSPYFGIVTEVDCTETYKLAKESNESFFAHYLHKSMKAVNLVEEFGYRIVNDEVIAFDIVHVGSTIARNDGTFGFSYFEYSDDFQIFNQNLQKEIDEVQNSTGLRIIFFRWFCRSNFFAFNSFFCFRLWRILMMFFEILNIFLETCNFCIMFLDIFFLIFNFVL
jgi:chloramphenicol O-acetyltransferase